MEEIHAAFPEHDKEWAQKLVDGIDSDHDGRVSLEEFRAYYHDELDSEALRKNTVRPLENSSQFDLFGNSRCKTQDSVF